MYRGGGGITEAILEVDITAVKPSVNIYIWIRTKCGIAKTKILCR